MPILERKNGGQETGLTTTSTKAITVQKQRTEGVVLRRHMDTSSRQTIAQIHTIFLNRYLQNELETQLNFSTKECLKYKTVNGHETDVYITTQKEVCCILLSDKSKMQNTLYTMSTFV